MLIDIGVNLADARFARDRDAVIDRARAQGVAALVLTGTNLTTSHAVAALARIAAAIDGGSSDLWLGVAAVGWIAAFAGFALVYGPYLARPRRKA